MHALTRARLVLGHGTTLGTLMADLAEVHGNRRLVTDAGGTQLTYRQAAKRVNRWAAGIAAKTQPGDRVVINTTNHYEQFLLCLAASRAGCIPAPVNAQMRADEVAHVVADAGAALVIRSVHQVDHPQALTEAVPAQPDEVAALFYTSGTTGQPKGAELTHRALIGQATAGALWTPALHRDECVYSLPIAHIMGFTVLVGMACLGVPCFLIAKFRPVEVLDAIEARRATVFIGVPAMFKMLLEAGATDPRPDLGAPVGFGRRRHAGRAGPHLQEAGGHRHPAPGRGGGPGHLRRGLRHGRGGRRRGGQGLAPWGRPGPG